MKETTVALSSKEEDILYAVLARKKLHRRPEFKKLMKITRASKLRRRRHRHPARAAIAWYVALSSRHHTR